MKVLIVGCKGQLGRELTKILAAGRSELGDIPAAFRGAQVTGVDLPDLDIADNDAVFAFVQAERPDVILNCAAMTNVDGCERDPDAAMKGNAIGPRNLAKAAEAASAKLLHVSTDYVFAGDGKKPYSEWDVCCPQSAYGASKYLGEQYVREFCSRYFIVRTAWLYGYEGGNFVKSILRKARAEGALTVVNDQRGNPTSAADLAHHVLKIAASEEYGVYHCTAAGECSWYDFACKIVELAGIPCTVTPCTSDDYPSPTKRPAYSALDNRMLRCTVGDEMRHWEDALHSFFQNYKEGE